MHLPKVTPKSLLIAVVVLFVVCDLVPGNAGWLAGPSGSRRRQASPTRNSRTTTGVGTTSSPDMVMTLCLVNITETETTAEACEDPTSFEEIHIQQRLTQRRSVTISEDAVCQWDNVDNEEEARIPYRLPEISCRHNEIENKYSCREVTNTFLVLRRGDCVNGAYIYNLVREEIVTGCVAVEQTSL